MTINITSKEASRLTRSRNRLNLADASITHVTDLETVPSGPASDPCA